MNTENKEKINPMELARIAGLTQSQIATIIQCSRAHVSMIYKGKRSLGFAQEMLLNNYLQSCNANHHVTLIPMPIKEKDLMQKLQAAIHAQEGDELTYEKLDLQYQEITDRLTSTYALVNTSIDYDLLNKDYTIRRLCARHTNIAKRRLDLYLAIKARATYISELQKYINDTVINHQSPLLPSGDNDSIDPSTCT